MPKSDQQDVAGFSRNQLHPLVKMFHSFGRQTEPEVSFSPVAAVGILCGFI